MALALVSYLSVLFPVLDNFVLRIIVVGVILIFMAIHIRSVKGGGFVQTFLTVLKILPFIVIIGFGAFFISGDTLMSVSETSTVGHNFGTD